MFNVVFLNASLFFLYVQILPSANHVMLPHPSRCEDTANVRAASQCYEWSGWSGCDVTCGTGTRHCNLLCHLNPLNGIYAQASQCFKTITQACQSYYHCPPVNGGLSAYTYGACSLTCGGGTRTGTRTCTNPTPQYGGAACTGTTSIIEPCNTQTCPVDGGWTEFGVPEPCSTSCGPGIEIERRTCTNPAPVGGSCAGSATNDVYCNEGVCPVDGVWSEWAVSIVCTASCGSGTRTYERVCNNPAPVGIGAACDTSINDDTKTEPCNTDPCPVDGVLSAWDTSAPCCAGEDQIQTRTCDGQVGTGAQCVGSLTQTVPCADSTVCPVDGQWSEFVSVDACSNSCGDGVRTQTRTCDNPAPVGTGAACSGSSVNTVACSTTC